MSSDQNGSAKDAAIDENLRLFYEPLLEEGVPDRFRDLLARLAEQSGSSGPKRGGDTHPDE